jgi:hypothetical protein
LVLLRPVRPDTIVSLAEPEDAIRDAFAAEAARGIDVVIDHLWGRPAELLLEAMANGFRASATRATRLVELGESAGETITLPGATLRSIDLKIMGGGLGSVPLDRVFGAIPKLFELAAAGILRINMERVPLADVESAWNCVEKGRRIVFTVSSRKTRLNRRFRGCDKNKDVAKMRMPLGYQFSDFSLFRQRAGKMVPEVVRSQCVVTGNTLLGLRCLRE